MKAKWIVAGIAAVALGACSRAGHKEASSVEVNNFEVREVLKTASRSYLLVFDTGDSAYLTLSATVQWPLKIGDHRLVNLQDTVIGTLGVPSPYSIDEAMSAYVSSYSSMFEGVKSATPVDTVPPSTEDVFSMEASVTTKVTELNEQTVTYQSTGYSYTGGAHPNTAVIPFTYDLETGQVLSYDYLFRPGSEGKVLDLIKESLANQLGVSGEKGLARAGIFTDQLAVSKELFISDGQIVFHYNPYDIAPYAMGQIDVPVAPFIVDSLLTEPARKLLLQ